jgi:hypothetical protein
MQYLVDASQSGVVCLVQHVDLQDQMPTVKVHHYGRRRKETLAPRNEGGKLSGPAAKVAATGERVDSPIRWRSVQGISLPKKLEAASLCAKLAIKDIQQNSALA